MSLINIFVHSSADFSAFVRDTKTFPFFLWHPTWMNLVVSIVISVIYKTAIKWTKIQWNFLVQWHSAKAKNGNNFTWCHETFQWKFVEMLKLNYWFIYILFSCCKLLDKKLSYCCVLLFYAIFVRNNFSFSGLCSGRRRWFLVENNKECTNKSVT